MDDNLTWLEQTAQSPSLYFKRLAIYRDPEQAPFREVPFRRGLNIVWAIEPAGEQAEGRRTAGHGVGKTSLCLLLRFCLGDESPNTTKLRKELVGSFPMGGVALIFEMQGQSYIVYRSFKYRKSDRIVRGDTLTDLWSGDPEREVTEFFGSLTPILLQHASCAVVPETGQVLEWRHLLAWMARDQEARFKSFYAWREGEGIGLLRSRQDPPVLLRSVLGLLKTEEFDLLKHLTVAKKALDDAANQTQALLQESELIKARIEADLRNLDPEMASLPLHTEDLFSPSLVDALTEKVQELNTSLEAWQGRYQALEGERLEAYRCCHPLEEDYRRIEQRLKRAEAARARDEKEFSRLTGELNRLKQLASDCEVACIPFSKCTHVQERIQILELPSIQGTKSKQALRSQMEEAGRHVEQHQQELESKHQEVEQQRQKINEVNSKQTQQLRIRDRIVEQASRFTTLLDELTRWESNNGSDQREKQFQSAKDHEKQHQDALGRIELKLEELRESRNTNEKKLEYIMQRLTENLLGNEFFGRFDPRSDEFPFGISAPGGEAYRVLEILLGDLACLLYSVSHESAFPGTLIHDCPREADMGPRLYEDYLNLVVAIEHYYAERGGKIPFQYIVTTTTPPPESLTNSEKVVLKLHPEDENEMLFRQRLHPQTQDNFA